MLGSENAIWAHGLRGHRQTVGRISCSRPSECHSRPRDFRTSSQHKETPSSWSHKPQRSIRTFLCGLWHEPGRELVEVGLPEGTLDRWMFCHSPMPAHKSNPGATKIIIHHSALPAPSRRPPSILHQTQTVLNKCCLDPQP